MRQLLGTVRGVIEGVRDEASVNRFRAGEPSEGRRVPCVDGERSFSFPEVIDVPRSIDSQDSECFLEGRPRPREAIDSSSGLDGWRAALTSRLGASFFHGANVLDIGLQLFEALQIFPGRVGFLQESSIVLVYDSAVGLRGFAICFHYPYRLSPLSNIGRRRSIHSDIDEVNVLIKRLQRRVKCGYGWLFLQSIFNTVASLIKRGGVIPPSPQVARPHALIIFERLC